ncbi:MAG: hypothetical protein PHO54_02775, partial [Candidatus Peribacteraceae bacterium]|nr:hypothetical protein [Candidatus Peribacteraceae bacterium]
MQFPLPHICRCPPKAAAVTLVLVMTVAAGGYAVLHKTSAPEDTFPDWQPVINSHWSYNFKLPASFSLVSKSDADELMRYRASG